MRETTLYTIKAQRVLSGDFVEIHQMCGSINDMTRVFREPNEAIISIEIQKVPVHMVSKIRYGERTDHYIALDPDLREILEAPFRSEMREMSYNLDEYRREHARIKANRNKFLSLSWYSRIWKALKRDI